MSNATGKTGYRKTTVVLSAILVLLVLFALSLLFIPPAYERYQLTHVAHIHYPVIDPANHKESPFINKVL